MNDAAGEDTARMRRIVRVRGRVQGVGFRMDAASTAQRLGVGGTVRNLLDGTVEADIEGPRDAVESMIEHLRQGPTSARVDGIDVRREAARGAVSFRITG
ncbi:acylphosphatase [Brachybacterium paraconglomeratum]|uniref:acylphosphatase n=1 Tax=Brachybacterium paraconglomeratum TaxID=173362 RepID=UPI0031EDC3C8